MSSEPDPAVTPILLYHDVVRGAPSSPWEIRVDDLAAQLDAVLRSGRAVLCASALDAVLLDGSQTARPRCAVTFDDGYASFAELVLPLLRERSLPATLYVTTGQLGLPNMLSESALSDLFGGPVEIGAHSVRHPHLDLLPLSAADDEIRRSRDHLAQLLGSVPASFAYPHGSFNRGVRGLVRDAGYANCYAVKNAFSHDRDDPYARARLTVLADTGQAVVDGWLAGRGAPRSWRRERLRTTVFRRVRAVRGRLS
ncbi:MAG TPA: polysaccharide deacetylase family protein [Catenuloplanes sp.]|jgi:peptidoglycan/xylan/chitin deacetylase (PgdA/CDA1 family)